MTQEILVAIIDDDQSLRIALISLVRSMGYAAMGYSSAEAFLADAAARGSACVVTDIHMGGLSGIELKEQLAREGDQTPVIMITARLEAGIEQRALAAGAFGFLRKPFDASTLMDCLGRAIGVARPTGAQSRG